jgi:hypothetical protein
LHNGLEMIVPEVDQQSSAFEFYRKQQEAWRINGNISAVNGMRDLSSPNDLTAWTLDKYKNMHILEKTWEIAPNREWWILIGADTYLI